ncbi:putative eukaryotic translation initiation factor 5 [Zancudomyces culisetae]|uniref:Putative eukaryotic translation initiation factor 5 n=1 Tax=Zancudomyces culisetae TaxID=1213189 RepID=A0A1R1PVU3_ZANCU|nr:putative eukaryotic translation initiation factor 5 [Zancudomyces culisetae]|eukprot:OMH85043.1 putative eukaryotic translation initiation factor 5 [Zancudomyces culisetae]
MTLVNIRRDVQDAFYRYKMPKIIGKIEGKGNGIKTVIVNMSEISRALSRPPAYPTKYFGSELGAQVKIEDKNERYIVNGVHEEEKLQTLLDGFIEKFVLCGNCKNPETDLVLKDSGIYRVCMACGKRTEVDMRHRLSTYILKNPPPKVKKGGQHASNDTSSGAMPNSVNGSLQNSEDEEFDRVARETANLKISNGDGGDSGWDIDADFSKEAIAARQRALGGTLISHGMGNGLGAEGEDDFENGDGGDDPYDQLADYIASENPSAKDVFSKAKQLGLSKKHRALVVIVLCYFKEKDLIKQLNDESNATLLRSFGDSEKHQRAIIGGFERFLGEMHPETLLPRTSVVFKALYDADIVDEEAFLTWAEKKPSKKYVSSRETSAKVQQQAEKFIQWLKEAESETDSDEE